MKRRRAALTAADVRRRVGQAIRVVRLERGLSQQELADRVGAAQPDISKWEHGIGTPVAVPRLLAIDAALDAPGGELLWRAGIHACPDSVSDLLERDPTLSPRARRMLLASYRAASHIPAS